MRGAKVSATAPRWMAAVAIVASATAMLIGLVSSAAHAALVSVPETGIPGHLSLRSDPYPAQFLELSPGDQRHWQIAADLVDPYAPLSVQIQRQGELIEHPRGLMIQVRGCDQPWSSFPANPACADSDTIISPHQASSASLGDLGPATSTTPWFDAGDAWAAQSRYLLVSLWIDDTPQARADKSLMDLEADIGFGVRAHGGAQPGPGPLPVTGTDPIGLVLLALGALGLGISIAFYARVRREAPR